MSYGAFFRITILKQNIIFALTYRSSSSNNNNKGQKEVAFKWRVEEVAESPARPGFCSAVIVCVLHGLHMSDWTFEAVKICFYYIRPSTLFSI